MNFAIANPLQTLNHNVPWNWSPASNNNKFFSTFRSSFITYALLATPPKHCLLVHVFPFWSNSSTRACTSFVWSKVKLKLALALCARQYKTKIIYILLHVHSQVCISFHYLLNEMMQWMPLYFYLPKAAITIL